MLALVLSVPLQFMRALSIPSPIYGGDEYAYFASGLFKDNLAELWQRDPGLQQIVNPLYLAIVNWSAQFFDDPAVVVRMLDVSGYLGMIAFAGYYVARHAGGRHALMFVLIASLLPSLGYAAAVMPEVLFYGTAVSAVLCLSNAVIERPWAGAMAAGSLTIVAFFLKPHATSFLVGIIAAQIVMTALFLIRRERWIDAAASIPIYIVSAYVSFIVLNLVLLHSVQLNPLGLLGNLYTGIASSTLNSAGGGLSMILYYFAANAAGVLLFFFPFVVVILLHGVEIFRRHREGAPLDLDALNLMVLIITVGGATILMVSMFTYSSGTRSPFEAYRIHGRYYAHLLILILIGGLSVRDWRRLLARPLFSETGWLDGYRLIGIGWLICIPIFLTLIWQFHVYPWDNPELYPLHRNELSAWKSSDHVTFFAAAVPFVLALAALAFVAQSRRVVMWLSAAVLAIFAMGTISNIRFQQAVITNNRILTEAGRFARDQFPSSSDSNVLVVGTDRYGAMAYLLFGMKCRCHVRSMPEGSQLTRSDLPAGVRMIFAVRSYPLDFPAELMFETPAGSFYRVAD